MTDFDYEVYQRRQIARQAKYKKNGSKSKKCSLPTDHMTQRQWKERNGKIMTYQLNRPMTWENFRKMPAHIQREYAESIISKYSTTATDLGKMFGVTPTTVTKALGDREINILFSPGKRMSRVQREEFDRFLRGENTKEHRNEEPEETSQIVEAVDTDKEEIRPVEEVIAKIASAEKTKTTSMSMRSFSLNFSGEVDIENLCNSLKALMPRDGEVSVNISCEVLG